MEPIPSNNNKEVVDLDDAKTLLRLASESIRHGLQKGRPLPVETRAFSSALRQDGASFVTLKIRGRLRGCIGTLEPARPLVSDVVDNAYASAFQDPRFPPLGADEYPELEIHISILSPTEEMTFTSEEDLLGQLRPGIDGIILQENLRRGTFLPSVWEELPNPSDFLKHLKRKAGLPVNYWSPTIKAYRYTVQYIP